MLNNQHLIPLMLADIHGKPFLPRGIPRQGLRYAQEGAGKNRPPADLDDKQRDTCLLLAQKWGIVVAEGSAGEDLVKEIEPLRRLREEEQGVAAEVIQVGEKESPEEFMRRTKLGRGDPNRPRYLIILGDAPDVSFDHQRWLMQSDCYTGRLCFPKLQDYRTYAEKVVRFSRQASVEKAAMAFYTATGSGETADAYRYLVAPSVDKINSSLKSGNLNISTLRNVGYSNFVENGLFDLATDADASVLLTASHGLGLEQDTPESVRQFRQGALTLDYGAASLDAETLAKHLEKKSFLPGGLWFCFACYSAGTPRESAYAHWLKLLADKGLAEARRIRARALASLPSGNENPFVARMPQVALAHPEGPIAFVGHVDIAFGYSYRDTNGGNDDAIFQSLRAWARGDRAATGLIQLVQLLGHRNRKLTQDEERRYNAELAGEPDPTDRLLHGHVWMARNDLEGYILLGDPAARLPLREFATTAPTGDTANVAPVVPAKLDRDAAVRALLEGRDSPISIATRAGVPLEDLWTWLRYDFARR